LFINNLLYSKKVPQREQNSAVDFDFLPQVGQVNLDRTVIGFPTKPPFLLIPLSLMTMTEDFDSTEPT
jgi:hypothetical protein